MSKSAHVHFSTITSLAELSAIAAEWRAARIERAADEWTFYTAGPSKECSAAIIAPPEWDRELQRTVQPYYSLDTCEGTCECGDQIRIDMFAKHLRRLDGTWADVGGQLLCKHFLILAIMREIEKPAAPPVLETVAAPVVPLTIDQMWRNFEAEFERRQAELSDSERWSYFERAMREMAAIERVTGLAHER